MTFIKLPLAAALAGIMALSACNETGGVGARPGDPSQKTKNGALIGAGAKTNPNRKENCLFKIAVSNKAGLQKHLHTYGYYIPLGFARGMGRTCPT